MSSTHFIILCGGTNSRWKGFRNTHRKHLVEVEGEILLNRTLRLVDAYRPDNVSVVINIGDRRLYETKLSFKPEFYEVPAAVPDQTEAYKFLSSKALWTTNDRTIILLGDVWFSEQAIATIFEHSAEDWTAFGRATRSEITGHPHGELFAQSFRSSEEHSRRLIELNDMYLKGKCIRPAAGWAHYCLMIGANPNEHNIGDRFIEIDDFTDDFDCAEDFNSWSAARARAYGNSTLAAPAIRTYVIADPKTGRNEPCPCGSGFKLKKCCGK